MTAIVKPLGLLLPALPPVQLVFFKPVPLKLIAITAPPVDGKANAHLTKFLSKAFKVPKGDIIIRKGELGRHKQVEVLTPRVIPAQIAELLDTRSC